MSAIVSAREHLQTYGLYSGDRMTREEFHCLYKATPKHFKAELVGGVVYVASPLKIQHGKNHFPIGSVIFAYESATPGVESGDNTTILLGDDAEPQPDIYLRILPEFGGQSTTSNEDYVKGAPELLTEIALSSRSLDLHAKREDYARYGVKEYLVFALREKKLYWFDLQKDRELKIDADGICRVRTFPGLWIHVAALLRRRPQTPDANIESRAKIGRTRGFCVKAGRCAAEAAEAQVGTTRCRPLDATDMKNVYRTSLLILLLAAAPTLAQGKKRTKSSTPEDDYYKILRFEPPANEVLESGAIEIMPDGKVALGTRRGEIWMIDNAYTDDPKDAKFTRFAHGLHEVLGLAQKDGWLYVIHRPDVSRIKDTNNDGKADVFEVVTDGWEINGDYHEYAFGSRFDKDGNIWIALCLTGSFNSSSKFRGWAGKVTPEGKFVPTTSGVRSPGGVGFDAEGNVFYTDNQGPWNGACSLKQITVGGFVGHPDSFKWYKEKEAKYLGEAPLVPKSGSRIHDRSQTHSAVLSAERHLPLRQNGAVRQRLRLRPIRRQVRPVREATLRRRSNAQHDHARLYGKDQRPLARRLFSVPLWARLGHRARAFRQGRLAVRRWHQSRLGLGRHQAIFHRTHRLDRQNAVRDPRNARQAGRFRTHIHEAGRSGNGGQDRIVPDDHLLLYLPIIVRQPGSRRNQTEDHQGGNRQRRQERPTLSGSLGRRARSRADRQRHPQRRWRSAAASKSLLHDELYSGKIAQMRKSWGREKVVTFPRCARRTTFHAKRGEYTIKGGKIVIGGTLH